jgi:polysaccharide export outer membrane protein
MFDEKSMESFESEFIIQDTSAYQLQAQDRIGLQIVSYDEKQNDVLSKMFSAGVSGGSGSANTMANPLNGFFIQEDGIIDLPLVGKIYLKGLTVKAAQDTVAKRISEYVTYSHVKLVLLSFRVSVLGEVRIPGTLLIDQQNVSLFQAIGMCNDFTDYADKRKVFLYRKSAEGYQAQRINLQDNHSLHHPLLLLKPNDIVYVQPLRAKTFKVNAPTISFGISIITFVLLLYNTFGQ